MRKIDKIIIHCSATPEGRDVSVAEICQWHKARGFNDVGYHWIIGLDGRIQPGRAEGIIGAHCTRQNANSIGVCYIGGLSKDGKTPKDTRTEAQRIALRKIVAELKKRYPGVTLHGHKEFAAKACPCFEIKDL